MKEFLVLTELGLVASKMVSMSRIYVSHSTDMGSAWEYLVNWENLKQVYTLGFIGIFVSHVNKLYEYTFIYMDINTGLY